jgi:hypothetical protein
MHMGPSVIVLTSGSWSIYRILENYKDANLGKVVQTLKRCFIGDNFGHEIKELIKKYPEAERYVALL